MHASHAELLRSVDPSALGARLRSVRATRGLTQAELAGDDFTAGYVSRIESGARRPTLKALTQFSHRLGTPVEELLRGVSASEYDEIRLGLDYAELALENGEGSEAERQAEESLARAEAAPVEEFVARGHYLLGRACEVQGKLDGAVREFGQVVATGSGLLSIHAAIALSRCHRESGDLALAIEVGECLQAALPQSGLDRTDEAVQLAVTTAAAYAERGDLSHATRVCRDAIERAEALGTPASRSAAYWNASIFQAERGHVREALPLASRALALLGEGTDSRNLARLRMEFGRLLLKSDPPSVQEALEHVSRAHDELRATSAGTIDMALCEVALAEAYLLSGDVARAVETAAKVEASQRPETALERAEAAIIRGHAESSMGHEAEALRAYDDAQRLLATCDTCRDTAQLWFDLADLLEQAGRTDSANAALRNAAAAAGLTTRRRRVAGSKFAAV
jgi:tetratricopeptide (TPR) repeat protein